MVLTGNFLGDVAPATAILDRLENRKSFLEEAA